MKIDYAALAQAMGPGKSHPSISQSFSSYPLLTTLTFISDCTEKALRHRIGEIRGPVKSTPTLTPTATTTKKTTVPPSKVVKSVKRGTKRTKTIANDLSSEEETIPPYPRNVLGQSRWEVKYGKPPNAADSEKKPEDDAGAGAGGLGGDEGNGLRGE